MLERFTVNQMNELLIAIVIAFLLLALMMICMVSQLQKEEYIIARIKKSKPYREDIDLLEEDI